MRPIRGNWRSYGDQERTGKSDDVSQRWWSTFNTEKVKSVERVYEIFPISTAQMMEKFSHLGGGGSSLTIPCDCRIDI